jgi:hypothetical protein
MSEINVQDINGQCRRSISVYLRMFLRIPDPERSLFCADPDLDPSINKQKKVRKTLALYFVNFLKFLSKKTVVNEPSKSTAILKNFEQKTYYFVSILSAIDEKTGSGTESGSVSQWYGSVDPDPYQKGTDPQHC